MVNQLRTTEKSPDTSIKSIHLNYQDKFDLDPISVKIYQDVIDYLIENDVEVFIIAYPEIMESTKGDAYNYFAKKITYHSSIYL